MDQDVEVMVSELETKDAARVGNIGSNIHMYIGFFTLCFLDHDTQASTFASLKPAHPGSLCIAIEADVQMRRTTGLQVIV